MKIKEIKNQKLGESVFCAEHSSGLKIFVMPKDGYNSAYALFGVKYGSIDTAVKNDSGEFETIPEGTAHYLEHKLFESEDLNAFERFNETGASANAFTSFEKTAYLFRCSENFEKSLEILLDFVQNPYFTPENVQKEQGIIGQEIRMYQDMADWKVMFNLLKALYSENPVRTDIAGTQESIAKIDADLLYRLYKSFYNPANMALTVVGNVEPKKVFEIVDKMIKTSKGERSQRKFVAESPLPNKKYVEEELSVSRKQFMLGYKLDISEPEMSLADEMATAVMLEAVCGHSSELFKRLMEEELIDMSFDCSLFNGSGYSCVMFSGTSDNPQKTAEIIKAEIASLCENGIDPEAFERSKRKFYGGFVMNYNDIDYIANWLMELEFRGEKPFSEMTVLPKVKLKDAQKKLEMLKDEYSALSVISPVKGGC